MGSGAIHSRKRVCQITCIAMFIAHEYQRRYAKVRPENRGAPCRSPDACLAVKMPMSCTVGNLEHGDGEWRGRSESRRKQTRIWLSVEMKVCRPTRFLWTSWQEAVSNGSC